MINIQNISVSRGKKRIVKEVSFSIKKGKISVLIGRNGAGKSTLLDAISGHDTTFSGEIIWDNLPLKSLRLNQLSQYRAVLAQQVQIAFPITVSALVEMGTYANTAVLSNRKTEQFINYALEAVEMIDFKNRDFTTLSGGEQKRVLLAKCIVQLYCNDNRNVDKYLFLDEPTASLDIEQQYKMIELIQKLVQQRNIGVFAILHDVNLAAQFADEILLMKNGRINHIGTPKSIINSKNLEETLGIQSIIQKHPILDCPYMITVKNASLKNFNLTTTYN